MNEYDAPESVPPMEALPPPSPEVQSAEADASRMGRLIEARIAYLQRLEEFLGPDPKEGDDKEQFVMRLVRYSIAQGAVITVQTDILRMLGLI
jgi:hypothetical protein